MDDREKLPPGGLVERLPVARATVHAAILRLVWDENKKEFVRKVVSETRGSNLLTSAGIVQMASQCYGTGSLLSNGFCYIGLSADSLTETSASTLLSNEITGNGLGRAIAAVTLPTGSGTSTVLRKTFNVTGTQNVRKAALFTAISSGVMQHPIAFASQQSLVNTDQFQVTFTITTALDPGFPLTASADNRTLVNTAGLHFPILGRASWNLLQETQANISTYLDDCVAKGFTAIETRAINSDGTTTGAVRATRAPFANNGTLLPFSHKLNGSTWNGDMPPTAFASYPNVNNDAPDFTTPVEAYWQHVDFVLAACRDRGLLVFFFPAYVGFKNTDQGWMKELVANDAVGKVVTYGQFVHDRYNFITYPNIIWMIGGDSGSGADAFTTAEADAEQHLISGLGSGGGDYWSAEWNSPAIFSDGITDSDINMGGDPHLSGAYDFVGDINTTGRRAYTENSGPSYALEYPYDQEGSDGTNVNAAATQPVRRFSWWGWLSTIGGYMTGNGFVWPFDAGDWDTHLNTTGAQDLARLNTFIKSIPWWTLTPSGLNGMRTLIPSGGSTPSNAAYVAAAMGTRLLVAYHPPAGAGTFTVDLRSFTVSNIRARWYDPTAGTYSTNGSAAGTYTLSNGTASQSFTTPGTNSGGSTDWVLVLDS